MRKGLWVPMVLLAVGCGDDESGSSARDIVVKRFPECQGHVSETNPEVRGNVIQFDCGQAVDGPVYYLERLTGRLICQCSELCDSGCPPAEFRR